MVGDIRNIIVIQSLSDTDKKTGEELYNDIIKRKIDYIQPVIIKMTHKFYNILSKNNFIELLNEIIIISELMTGGVLIHLEMHGASDKSSLVFADNTNIEWEEIVDLFREINIITKNNLYITMATCYGRYLFEGVKLQKKSPYSGYISASKSVYESEILEDFSILFESLIISGNLVLSYLELEKNGSNFYYKDSKSTFEENFEAFKNNPIFKKQILDAATKTVMENGGEIADEKMSNLIYNSALNQAYNEQIKNFEF